MSDTQDRNSNRSTTPGSDRFQEFMAGGWRVVETNIPGLTAAAAAAAPRREKLSALYRGSRVVIPAGPLTRRSNDTDFRYRPHSAFSYLTGWGHETVPDSILVFDPTSHGHEVTLYMRPTATRETDEFYADPAIGEFWVGARPGLAAVSGLLGLPTKTLDSWRAIAHEGAPPTVVVADADSHVTALVSQDAEKDAALARDISEMRLVKDDFEISELRNAIASTARGFDDVLSDLPRIRQQRRGERIIEGVFETRARLEGNEVGYGSIAAAGAHATILHWTRNDGAVRDGDVVLLDAGVERESLYTADITRTFPVNGSFTPTQREVYEAVRAAADAAFAIVKPGIIFRDVHAAAMKVIAARLDDWGFLPVSATESLLPENQFHRRYMVHGTSHHLGLDVHDCAHARREMYMDGEVKAGMVFTIEPGLYFQSDDETVPPEFRGIGIRIEDDILVTPTGAENLSIGIPRTADDVEAWVRRLTV